MDTVHCEEGQLPIVGCTVTGCSKTFSRRYNMLRHVKRDHKGRIDRELVGESHVDRIE